MYGWVHSLLIQLGFSHLFVVYSEPIEIVWRSHLSFYLSHYPIRVMNPSVNGNIYYYWNHSGMTCVKSWWSTPPPSYFIRSMHEGFNLCFLELLYKWFGFEQNSWDGNKGMVPWIQGEGSVPTQDGVQRFTNSSSWSKQVNWVFSTNYDYTLYLCKLMS